MTALTQTTPLVVLAFAMVLCGGLLIIKGVCGWTSQRPGVAAQPLQRDRVVVYLAALLVAAGAAVFAANDAHGAALAVLATAVVPVLLILPGSYNFMIFYPSLITVTVGTAMALRTLLAPGIPVTLVSVLAFVVIATAGGYLLRGLVDAVPLLDWGTEEERRARAFGRLVCGLAGLALLPAPLLWLFTGHRWLAALSMPFLLVAVVALVDRKYPTGWLVYIITGPMAIGAAIYALFADR